MRRRGRGLSERMPRAKLSIKEEREKVIWYLTTLVPSQALLRLVYANRRKPGVVVRILKECIEAQSILA